MLAAIQSGRAERVRRGRERATFVREPFGQTQILQSASRRRWLRRD